MDSYFLVTLVLTIFASFVAIFLRIEERKKSQEGDISADDFEILEN